MSIPDVRKTEEWVVVWFPPDFPQRRKSCKTEEEAQVYAATNENAAQWNPLIEHKVTTISEISRYVPLRSH